MKIDMPNMVLGLYLLLFVPSVLLAQSEETLFFADPLTNNMVIQQNQPFTVLGRAPIGSEVTITSDWTSKVNVITNKKGWFKGIIPVPSVKKGDFSEHEISIQSGSEIKTLTNILIGDLWICSGQSNMQFSVKESTSASETLKNADRPNIRLFNAGLNFSDSPLMEISGKWQLCNSETIKDFSAVGYFFGSKLQEKLDIPIGLLFTGIGASAAQAYVPKHVLSSDKLLDSVYLQPYLKSERSKEEINGGFSFEKVTRPYLLYNALIHPLTNLSIKGVVWYQGESNRNERESYTHLMFKMIEAWREAFGQGDFPFYFVQVAPYFQDIENPKLADYAFFREAQENIAKLGNTEMVITMDVGEAKDLHPKTKKPIGERLAYTALNQTYNQLDVSYKGPSFNSVSFEKRKAFVSFDSVSVKSGLQTNDGESPKYFQLAGKNKVFYQANATINGKNIIVSCKEVKHPVAVRYAFTNYPVTNLENKEGFPVVPFRSDNWDE